MTKETRNHFTDALDIPTLEVTDIGLRWKGTGLKALFYQALPRDDM